MTSPLIVTTTKTTTTNGSSSGNAGTAGLIYPTTGVAASSHNNNNNNSNTIRLRLRLSAMNLPRPKRVHVRKHRRASPSPDAACCLVTCQRTGDIWGQTEAIRSGGGGSSSRGSSSSRHPQWTRTCLIEYEYGTTVQFYTHVFLQPSCGEDTGTSAFSSSEEERHESDDNQQQYDGSSHHHHHHHHRRNESIQSNTSATRQGSYNHNPHHQQQQQQQRVSLGTALFEVGDILGSVYQTKIKRLRAGGCVICRLEMCDSSNQILELQFRMTTPLVMPHEVRRRLLQSLTVTAEPDTVLEIAKPPRGATTRQYSSYPQQQQQQNRQQQQQQQQSSSTITSAPPPPPPQSPTPSDRRIASSSSAWITMWRSQPVLESLQPEWDCAQLDVGVMLDNKTNHGTTRATTADGDDDNERKWKQQPLRLSVKEGRGGQLIGVAETTVGHLLEAAHHQKPLFLQRSDIKFKPVGQIQVMQARILKEGGNIITVNHDGGNGTTAAATTTTFPATNTNAIATPMDTMPNDAAAAACGAGSYNAAAAAAAAAAGSSEMFAEVVDLASLQPLAAPLANNNIDNNSKNIETSTSPSKPFSYYVQRGLDIDFSVAIDFTSSNGDPRVPTSYHYQGSNDDDCLNDYEETILTVGKALAQYNKTHEYAVWGFGAKFNDQIRHIFQCGPTPVVHGVQGILHAYQSVFESDLTMSGPTEFLQVLQAGAARAKRIHDQPMSGNNLQQQRLKYMVLLIITDGVMHNVEETRRKLQVYSFLPMSVIFVGVGRSSFDALKGLCTIARSNTTFVEFRHQQHSPTALGQAALQNIPQQICAYMQSRGV